MTVLGIVVLAAGATLLAVEAHVPAAGLIASAGAAALVAGAALAVVGAGGGAIVAVAVAALVGALAVAGVLAVVRSHSDVRRWLPRGGASGLEGRVATVRNWNG